MKKIGTFVFWLVVAIAAVRTYYSSSFVAWRERLVCTYKDPDGNCLSEDEHIRRIAHDAAVDAISEWRAQCSGYNSSTNPDCAVFHQN
ncbi:hypothetical protein [Burkholderia pseudomallei]|uniref:hypothetical protein n=1 Tax=Burkholderia pseudomallei TaxID=28450 RepID=UPI00039FFFEE|nr:hypothetical protein [Burkholderia pseudomallei]OAG63969.1 hypothetical protein BIM11_4633 [Burkholderia pseudomallei]